MEFHSLEEMKERLAPVMSWNTDVTVHDREAFRDRAIDALVWTAVFAADPLTRATSRWLIRRAAVAMGAWPASILDLYIARGRGVGPAFTVPAFNIRTLTYDTARAAFRAAKSAGVGAFIMELARSEIGYTEQRPAEYAAVVLGAAVRERFEGPVFLQGDHYQVNAAKHASDPTSETSAIEALIVEALEAGVFNIDIDTSTLVDLSRASIPEQQEVNCDLAARFTRHIWASEPAGVRVSIGGEIGEVGGVNSTAEELTAFMDGYARRCGEPPAGHGRISKISVQTGTSHGGTPLPDGSIAPVAIDFGVIRELSVLSQKRYGLAGVVQHGASTLPDEAFGRFPESGAAEIHLATGFQNMVLDHPRIPAELRAEMKTWTIKECASERKAGQTEEQFLYKSRKKALGPFKRALWSMPADARAAIGADIEAKFAFYFRALRVAGTAGLVREQTGPLDVPCPPPDPLAVAALGRDAHREKDLPASEHAD